MRLAEMIIDGVKTEADFWRAKRNIKNASLRVLRRILKKASETKFGRFYKIKADMSERDFRSALPIQTYSDYQPWIERIKKGEQDVLWQGLPISFAITSGTTGESKIIPVSNDYIQDYHNDNRITIHRALLYHPELIFGKALMLGGPSVIGYFGTIPYGALTGILFSTFSKFISSHFVIPADSYNIEFFEENLYIIARLALEAKISAIVSAAPGSLLVLSNVIEKMAGKFIKEIREGSFSDLKSAPLTVRQFLQKNIKPNPARADELQNILLKKGLIVPKDVWPIRLICAYMKEGTDIQWQKIREYYGGNVSIMDPGVVASEGRVSIGLLENETSSAVIPSASFIEFMPVDISESEVINKNKHTVLPYELKDQMLYSPIISSRNGLLRYSAGDVVRVSKIKKGIPFIEFVGRLDGAVSVAGEKITEAHFRQAVELLSKKGYQIGNWAVYIDTSCPIPYYVFVCAHGKMKISCKYVAKELDKVLGEANMIYRKNREKSLLSPLKVKLAVMGSDDMLSKVSRFRLGQTKQKRIFKNYKSFIEGRPDLILA